MEGRMQRKIGVQLQGWLMIVFLLAVSLNNNRVLMHALATTNDESIKNILVGEHFKQTLKKMGQYRNRFGAPVDVEVQDELAFVASDPGTLLIFNISDPTSSQLLSTFSEERTVSQEDRAINDFVPWIEISGNIAVLADYDKGLLFINVSNPTMPILLGKFQGKIERFTVQGNFAYVIDRGTAHSAGGNVFRIINFSDPTRPFLTGEINRTQSGGYYSEPVFSKGYLFTSPDANLVTIDVSDPSNPVEVASVDIGGGNELAKVGDNYLLVGSDRIGESSLLKVVNITDPLAPELLTTFETSAKDIDCIVATSSTAFFSDTYRHRIYIINITDIEHPTEISHFNNSLGINFNIYALALGEPLNEVLYCADYTSGFYTLDVSNVRQLALLDYFDTNGKAWRLAIDGDYAYLVSKPAGFFFSHSRLEIINIANTSHPELVATYKYPHNGIMDVAVADGYAYLSIAKIGLQILDVHNPTNIVLVGNYTYQSQIGNFHNLWFDTKLKFCYLTHDNYGLFIINCRKPTNPTLNSHIQIAEPGFQLTNLFVEGEIAYLTSIGYDGIMLIVDTSIPANPVALSWVYFSAGLTDIFVQGKFAYVTTWFDTLYVLDITDKRNPVKTAQFNNNWGWTEALCVKGPYAYIAQIYGGLRVIDITNPHDPVTIAAVIDDYRGFCNDVLYHDGLIFIADGWNGLEIYQLVTPNNVAKILYSTAFLLPTSGFVLVLILIERKSHIKKRDLKGT